MKVLAIIQARMGSTRLPGKVMMKLEGKPILEHIIEFLRFSKLINQIVVATTELPEDDKIEELCKSIKVDCYRGSSDDVLKRYYEAAKHFKGDLIIRITADDPLLDPTLVDEIVRVCVETKCDYASNILHRTHALGYLVEGLTFSTLEKLHKNQTDLSTREHVTQHILDNPNLYNVREITASSNLARPCWRLTVDHIEDLELMSEIFSRLYVPNSYISYQSVVKLLDNNEKILCINKKYWQ